MRCIMLAIAITITLLLFWPALLYGWDKWETDPNYGHAYFVPLAAAYLIWRKRAVLRELPVQPSAVGFALVIPSVILHILSANAGLLRFSMMAFVVVLAGLILLIFGWSYLRHLSFPLAFLLLAVPIPLYLESITLPMKIAASATSVQILSVFGLSMYREGTIIHLPNLTLEVATACSGIKSLVLVCTVGAFYGYITQSKNTLRCIIFLASIPIALCANIARIVATAILSNYASGESMREFIHDFSGAFVFVVAGVMFTFTGMIVDSCANYLERRNGGDTDSQTDGDHTMASGNHGEET